MKRSIISGLILCLCCTLSSPNLSAQEYKNFDLNKYYTPDIVRRGLDFYFNTNGGISSNHLSENPNNVDEKDTSNFNNLSGQLKSSFFTFKSTRKKESLLQLNLDLWGRFTNSDYKPISSYYTPNSHALGSEENIGLTYTNKTYNKAKQFFSFGVTSNLRYSSGRDNRTLADTHELKYTNYSFNSSITPYAGVGVGRLEMVTDARQAIYILDDLSKRGVLTRRLTDDEIFRFSQQISLAKNKRFLDARLHKIEEISTVDSFLVSNGLLAKSDATYFTTLYDIWENGANFERRSGQMFEIKLSPSSSWDNSKNQTDTLNGSTIWTKNKQEQYGIDLAINYQYAKQMGHNWEKVASVSLIGSTSNQNQNRYSTEAANEYSNKQNTGFVNFNGSYGIGYYPNTRTHLSAQLSQYFLEYFTDKDIDLNWTNVFRSNTNLSFSAVYYVSPQLSLSGLAWIYNNYQNETYPSTYKKNNNLGAQFSASIKYSLF